MLNKLRYWLNLFFPRICHLTLWSKSKVNVLLESTEVTALVSTQLKHLIYIWSSASCFQVPLESNTNFKRLLWIAMPSNSSMANVLKWERGKLCFTEIAWLLSSKKLHCCLTLMLTAPKFCLNIFKCPWKIPPSLLKGSRCSAHIWKRFACEEKKKSLTFKQHPVPLFVFPSPYLYLIMYNLRSNTRKCQFPWVTGVNLIPQSLQIGCVVILQLLKYFSSAY